MKQHQIKQRRDEFMAFISKFTGYIPSNSSNPKTRLPASLLFRKNTSGLLRTSQTSWACKSRQIWIFDKALPVDSPSEFKISLELDLKQILYVWKICNSKFLSMSSDYGRFFYSSNGRKTRWRFFLLRFFVLHVRLTGTVYKNRISDKSTCWQ